MMENKKTPQSDELKKLMAIATDLTIAAELRIKAIELVGNMSNHDALLALLEIVANTKLVTKERELALKHAGEIVKSER